MASPAMDPTRASGWIEPRRPGDYPIVLGESLKGNGKTKESLVNIRYNWQPKAGFGSHESKLTSLDDKYQLVIPEGDSGDEEYRYTGVMNEQNSAQAEGSQGKLALVYDKAKSVLVLELMSTSLDMNLKERPGYSSKETRQLPQIPGPQRSSEGSAPKSGRGKHTASEDDETPDASNPYDFRHFLAEARENLEKPTQPGNRTPLPAGSLTPLSGISTPIHSTSRLSATTPQFRPAAAASKPAPPKNAKTSDPTRNPGHTPAASSAAIKSTTKRNPPKPSSNQPLSKARISDSDEDDGDDVDDTTIEVSRLASKTPASAPPKASKSKTNNQPSSNKGHARNVSKNIGLSPHIIINDDDGGLEIDMGSPPPQVRARRGRVDPEMFRSHTGTPIAGLSANRQTKPASAPTEEDRGHGGNRVSMKDIEATDEDADVEEFELGSPRDKRLSLPHSGDVSMRDDDDDEVNELQRKREEPPPTPPAPVVHDEDDDEDDEALLAAELEAALEEEDDEEQGHGIGLGIGMMGTQDDESEISEEE